MEKVMEFEVLKRVPTLGLQLDWKNNIFARASRFSVHFFAVATRLQPVKVPNFTFCPGRERRQRLSCSFPEL